MENTEKSDYNTLPATASFEERQRALANSLPPDYLAVANFGSSLRDIAPNISSKPAFNRRNYQNFRSNEAIPEKPKDIIQTCNNMYQHVGIIQNIIDLMTDFACQGVDVSSANPEEDKIIKYWFNNIISGKKISERFLNYFYRLGNVHIRRVTGKLSLTRIKKIAKGAIEDVQELQELTKYEIPIRYVFINPAKVEPLDSDIYAILDQNILKMEISPTLVKTLKDPNLPVKVKIPPDLQRAIDNNQHYIILDPAKVVSYYYRKNDWESFAYPMTFAVLDDVILLTKAKLSDLAALDGAINKVRIWLLGDLSNPNNPIIPGVEAFNKLNTILTSNIGGGPIDLIWNSAIDVKETKVDIQQFLGNEKYSPILTSIYSGLGIPATLTGSSDNSSFNNNFVAMKVLIERLNYGRNNLVTFLNNEIRMVKKSLGLKSKIKVTFDRMNLSDEAAMLKLYLDMVDRNILSEERFREIVGEFHDLEESRIKQEFNKRKKYKNPKKLGPFGFENFMDELIKVWVTNKVILPSQMGLELEPPTKVEKEMVNPTRPGPNGTGGGKPRTPQGRPLNQKDKKIRKTRTTNELLEYMFWADKQQQLINEVATSTLLRYYNINNVRQMSTKQFQNLEQMKFGMLMHTVPFTETSKEYYQDMIKNSEFMPTELHTNIYQVFSNQYHEKFNKELSVEESRKLFSYIYAIVCTTKV